MSEIGLKDIRSSSSPAVSSPGSSSATRSATFSLWMSSAYVRARTWADWIASKSLAALLWLPTKRVASAS